MGGNRVSRCRHPQHTEAMILDRAVILIPKNASTSIRETLAGQGYERTINYDRLQDKKIYAVIREPLNRFLTAFITVERLSAGKSINKYDLLGDFVLTIHRLNEYPDYHYLPQSQFLKDAGGKPLPIHKYILFDDLDDYGLPLLNPCIYVEDMRRVRSYLSRHWDLTGYINRFYADDQKLYNDLKRGLHGDKKRHTGWK